MEFLTQIGVDLFNAVASAVLQIPVIEQIVTVASNFSGLSVAGVLGLIVLGAVFSD